MSLIADAIDRDSILEVKKLIEGGEDINQLLIVGEEYDLDSPDEISILNYAIRRGASLELISFLVDMGADIFAVDKEGVGTLDIAIKFKRYDVAQYCIDCGIDPNTTKRKSGILPIILASCFNDVTMIELLVKNGVDINARDKNGMSASDYALKMGQKKAAKFFEDIKE